MTSLHVGMNFIPEKEMKEIITIAMCMDSMKILCEVPIKDKALTMLDISGKNLGMEGALAVAEYLRDNGAMTGAFGEAPVEVLLAAAQADPGTAGVDLVSEVSTPESYFHGNGPWNVVAYDLGIKRSIVEQLGEIATVEVVPASTSAAEVLARKPDGIFLSNGPGDPEMAGEVVDAIREFLGKVPVFGICLGHQVLSLALGGKAYKMKFGHHGGNVPVRNRTDGTVEITSQNHNFAIEVGSVPNVTETHVCLNDGALEGLRCNDLPAFSVQYHPEASPGPHDSQYLFQEFAQLMSDFADTAAAGEVG